MDGPRGSRGGDARRAPGPALIALRGHKAELISSPVQPVVVMTLISKLKDFLGLSGGSRDAGGTTVTVERETADESESPPEPEPAVETERAVKETVPAAADEPATTAAADAETDEPGAATADHEPAADEPESTSAAPEATVDDHDAGAVEAADESVQSISGIGQAYGNRLAEAGVHTVGDLAAADADELAAETGLGEGRVAGWIEQAKGPE